LGGRGQAHSSVGIGDAVVTTVCFVPAHPSYFIAGRSDGSVSLYVIDEPRPLFCWQGFSDAAVAKLLWAPTRPSAFWVVGADAKVHMYDLAVRQHEPVVTATLIPPASSSSASPFAPTPRFAISSRSRAAKRSAAATSLLALNCTSSEDKAAVGGCGEVEVHLLDERLVTAQPGEEEALRTLFDGF